jgi:hypothetical protein
MRGKLAGWGGKRTKGKTFVFEKEAGRVKGRKARLL